jgi:steroid delta-isomerase-like uncharacterized protein
MSIDLIREWMDGWNAHDADRVAAVFTDDCVYEDVTFGVVNRGKDELRAFVNGFVAVAPDCAFEPGKSFVAGDFGGAEWTATGTQKGDMPGMPASNRSFSIRGASIFELRDGLLHRCSDYWDMAIFMRQLGFLR